MPDLPSARARLEAEPRLHRDVRARLRELWDAALVLEAGVPEPRSALCALRREALRLANQALPSTILADDAEARLLLARLEAGGADEARDELLSLGRAAHERALRVLEEPARAYERALRRRQVVAALLTIAACLVTAVGGDLLWRASQPDDLAAGKPFTTSSTWAECHPEKNECGGFPTRILFHTRQESSPWFRVDLGAPTRFSSATIVNRQDMALPLAVPLVFEVSEDGASFREVARRNENFNVWLITFPEQQARYVRVRVDRLSTLHLEAVRVHP